MSHQHCDACYSIDCGQTSECPIINCVDGCSARMHSCKSEDHRNVCPNILVQCLNQTYGCPLTLRRRHLNRHLLVCAASVVVCTFRHAYQNHSIDNHNPTMLPEIIARRDNLWSKHLFDVENNERENFQQWKSNKTESKIVDRSIRSEKYPYITMPECVLSKSDGVICITCRLHLRQLEEAENQRLAELGESQNEQQFIENYVDSDSTLVKMSITQIEAKDSPSSSSASNSTPTPTTTTETETKSIVRPVQSDIDFGSSFLYRLKYFSLDHSNETIKNPEQSPSFRCSAFCRRDELEQHHKIHHFFDRELNNNVFQRCPKAQYGCSFQVQKIEPYQKNGQAVRIRFDHFNDAIGFEYDSAVNSNNAENYSLLNLPNEVLIQILGHLDSLSLRNVSIVCHRLREQCENLLTSHGIVVNEYECCSLLHGETTWIERRKHWLYTNTSSNVDFRPIGELSKSVSQHIIECSFGSTIDMQSQKRHRLVCMGLPEQDSETN